MPSYTWLWLDPMPRPMVAAETYEGVQYRVTATPIDAGSDFGDGEGAGYTGGSSFGAPFPAHSAVTHTFQANSRLGYPVRTRVSYAVSWTALVDGTWSGPYPMGTTAQAAVPLVYPVEQAQPELLRLGA